MGKGEYIQSVKVLFIIGEIDKKEYESLLFFNKMRNQIVHGLFKEIYEDGIKGVLKSEFDKAFKLGIGLCDILQLKTEIKIEQGYLSNMHNNPDDQVPVNRSEV